jgi:hypothetical protein
MEQACHHVPRLLLISYVLHIGQRSIMQRADATLIPQRYNFDDRVLFSCANVVRAASQREQATS